MPEFFTSSASATSLYNKVRDPFAPNVSIRCDGLRRVRPARGVTSCVSVQGRGSASAGGRSGRRLARAVVVERHPALHGRYVLPASGPLGACAQRGLGRAACGGSVGPYVETL